MLLHVAAQRFSAGLRVGRNFLFAFGLGHLDQLDIVREPLVEVGIGVERGLQRLAFAHDLLRALGVVPQRRVLDFRVQLVEALVRGIPVKDASVSSARDSRMSSTMACASARMSGSRIGLKARRQDTPSRFLLM